jgi:hypothetical protein
MGTPRVSVKIGMDEQSNFRANRGTIDSLFTASIGLQKRKEQNLETWVLFVDLVKAFDRERHPSVVQSHYFLI